MKGGGGEKKKRKPENLGGSRRAGARKIYEQGANATFHWGGKSQSREKSIKQTAMASRSKGKRKKEKKC